MSSQNNDSTHEKYLKHALKQVDRVQEGPRYGNQYLEDPALINYVNFFLKYDLKIPGNLCKKIVQELTSIGQNVLEYQKWNVESEENPPSLKIYNAFGEKINKIINSQAWHNLNRASVEEKIIGQAYNNEFLEANRLVEFAKLYMFHASGGIWGCPMAMTDGAAFVLRKCMENQKTHPYINQIRHAYNRLTSLDPNNNWTSGQWMTEKDGGSDVSRGTRTMAVEVTGRPSLYKLYGLKWFTSATESEVSIALARIVDSKTGQPDSRLSAFLVHLHDKNGNIKKEIEILRLKNKLGTKPVPTAELVLKGVEAILISDRTKGVRFISGMLNVTRLYNASTAVSYARRLVALNKDYAFR